MTVADHASRKRRAAVAGHTGDETAARALVADADPGVRGAALQALARMDRLGDAELAAALGDIDPSVRRRACQLAAGRPDVELAPLLDDPDERVVEMAAWALGEHESPDAVEPLCRVATEHADALCREAAVAALGAIGDERGLAAILRATGDKPAVRRRAVLALAPYDGPEVDAALRRALEDRDWQVRQAAEDLLAD